MTLSEKAADLYTIYFYLNYIFNAPRE